MNTDQEARKSSLGEDIPVLIMTGLDDPESIKQAYPCGAADFTTKPLHWLMLPYRVQYMIRPGRTTKQLRDSEGQYSSLVNNTPDIIHALNKNGTVPTIRAA